jgi:capsular polysaccharide transport system permease protein
MDTFTPDSPGTDLTAAPNTAAAAHKPDKWTDTLLNLNVDDYIWAQRKKFLLHLFVFILAPTILSAIYVGFYATPRYVSEFQILYHPGEKSSALPSTGSGGLLSSLLGSSSSVDMTRVIDAYLSSKAVVAAVEPNVGLKKMYSAPNIDWLDRLSPDAPADKLQAYFKKRVSVYEENGGFILVDVEAFTASDAHNLALALIQSVDELVSDMYDRPKRESVEFNRGEVQRNEKELVDATQAVTTFREKHSDYDFSKSVGQLSGVVGGLQSQLADIMSQLQSVHSLMGANAPQVSVLNARIDALRGQIKVERDKLASSGRPDGDVGGAPYSQVMATYESLLQAQDFARQLYLASRQSYESARENAARKDAYIVSFVPPSMPDRATAPNASTHIWTTFFACLTLYAVGSILIGLVRDQTGM